MKRIITGILLTLVLLVVARQLSMNQPEEISVTGHNLKVSHSSVFEQVGAGASRLDLDIVPAGDEMPGSCRGVEIIYTVSGNSESIRVPMENTGGISWTGYLPSMEKGNRVRYFFEVATGEDCMVRLPEEKDRTLLVKYKGKVSSLVLFLHIIFMFGAFFFMIEAALSALEVLRKKEGKGATIVMIRWLMFFTFAGGWPLGFILNMQRFGPVWEGFPFGYDITDNKTQLMFIFWIVTIFLSWSSFTGRSEEKDRLGRKGFAVVVLTSFVLSFAIFLIPHSL